MQNNYLQEEVDTTVSYGSTAQFDSPAIAREIATIQGQIVVAKKFPRDEQMVFKRLEKVCSRETLANTAMYEYSRGGTSIVGPSIRLAEALAKAYGNLKYGIEELENAGGESKVRAFAYDLEANTMAERIFTVKHIRDTRNGSKKLTEQRDIYELVANQGSRRLRACILEAIPADIVDYAVGLCNKTRAAHVRLTPETFSALENAFKGFGVNRAMIEGLIQCKLEAISTGKYLRLRDIYASLKDGMGTVEDFFDTSLSDAAQAAQKAQKKVEQKQAKKIEAPKAEAPKAKPAPEAIQEAPQEEAPAGERLEDDIDLDALWNDTGEF